MMLRTLAVCCMSAFALAQGDVEMCPADRAAFTKTCMTLHPRVSAAGNGRTPQPQIADDNLGLGSASPGSRVWKDLKESAWKQLPEWLVGASTIVASSLLDTTGDMFWFCNPTGGSQYCEIYLFAYACEGICGHLYDSGDFIQLALGEGFDPIYCGLSVHARNGGSEHKMVAFRKLIPAGEYTLFLNSGKTEFAAFGIDASPVLCPSFADEDSCNNDSKGKCEYLYGECVLKKCNRKRSGPGPVCTTLCISEDL